MKNIIIVLLVICIIPFADTFSQEEHSAEVQSAVPELSAFHEVIYPIWHTAYPNKDYELLRQLQPDVNSGVEKISAAKLPGILRDKEGEWNEGLKKLQSSVENYNKAIAENDESAMLAAAEVLHANYEMMVRIIRPVTKEVDEFHKVLYMIYHHYGPGKQTIELNNAIDTLVVRAGNLKNSVLPKRAASKKDEFIKLAGELNVAVQELQKLKNEEAAILDEAIEKVHTRYLKLEALFD